jgi:hypothetical protein
MQKNLQMPEMVFSVNEERTDAAMNGPTDGWLLGYTTYLLVLLTSDLQWF